MKCCLYNPERHLLYVACTRARDQLIITDIDAASEFLDELALSRQIPLRKGQDMSETAELQCQHNQRNSPRFQTISQISIFELLNCVPDDVLPP